MGLMGGVATYLKLSLDQLNLVSSHYSVINNNILNMSVLFHSTDFKEATFTSGRRRNAVMDRIIIVLLFVNSMKGGIKNIQGVPL